MTSIESQDNKDPVMWKYKDFNTLRDNGHKTSPGYKRIKVHLIFNVKHNGRFKGRCVADGHLTGIPLESVYSGVITIQGVRMVTFLSELNDLELWQTDVSNAYLEAKTSEKLYIIAGSELGPELQGHVLIIHKAQYGLRTSGREWHIRLPECMEALGFTMCSAKLDIWTRTARNKNGIEVCEYVAVYVEDLLLAMVDPQDFVQHLMDKYQFKFKGTGAVTFHLGVDFTCNPDGTFVMSFKKYIERMMTEYKQMFWESPKYRTSPLNPGDYPEIDTSDSVSESDITGYQSLIGPLQWAFTIGRLDIQTYIMSLLSFHAMPRVGHLNRAKQLYGYLYKMQHAATRIRTGELEYSALPTQVHDWSHSVYSTSLEIIPTSAPKTTWK